MANDTPWYLKISKGIAVFIVAPCIVGFLLYFINYSKPDVRYFLSGAVENVESNGIGKSIIQELNVINKGNSTADDIIVKVDHVDNYKLIPFAKSDEYKSGIDENQLEVSYKKLAPDASFKIVISSSFEIRKYGLVVHYADGKARDLFEKSVFDSAYFNAMAIYILGAIIIFYTSFKMLSNNTRLGWSKYKQEYFLSLTKPYFVEGERWAEARRDAIDGLFKDYAYDLDDLMQSNAYKFICGAKVYILSTEENERAINKAVASIEGSLNKILTTFYIDDPTIKRVSRIEKPNDFPEGKWKDLGNKLSDIYVAKRFADLKYNDLAKFPINNIGEKPDFVKKQDWDSLCSFAALVEFASNLEKITLSSNPVEYVEKSRFKFLDSNYKARLKELSMYLELCKNYHISNLYNYEHAKAFIGLECDWIDEYTKNILKGIAYGTIENEKIIMKSAWIIKQFESILNNINIEDKPAHVDEETYKKIAKLSCDIVDKHKELKGYESEVEEIRISTLEKGLFFERRIAILKDMISGIDVQYDNVKGIVTHEEFELFSRLVKK